MKAISLLFVFSLSIFSLAHGQTQGKVYGSKPSAGSVVDASKVMAFMGNKTRISTTIRGKVIKVINPKGGWFNIDAGNGKVIPAHFKDYNVTIPADLNGRTVIAEGVMAKQFTADESQHLAGSSKEHGGNNKGINFEVTGLMVE